MILSPLQWCFWSSRQFTFRLREWQRVFQIRNCSTGFHRECRFQAVLSHIVRGKNFIHILYFWFYQTTDQNLKCGNGWKVSMLYILWPIFHSWQKNSPLQIIWIHSIFFILARLIIEKSRRMKENGNDSSLADSKHLSN